jgi:periplasmic protein CpxP/Spy
MKKLVLIMVALFTINGMAQEKQAVSGEKMTKEKVTKTPEDVAGMETKKLTQKLELTSEQQKEVYTILLEKAKLNAESYAELRKMKSSEEKPSKEDFKTVKRKMMEQQKITDSKLKEVLSEKQFSSYQEMHGQKRRVKSKQLTKG